MFQSSFSKMLLAVFTALIWAQTSIEPNARVIVKETNIYYPVTGKTGKEIFKSFRENKLKVKHKHLFGGQYSIASSDFKIDVKNIRKLDKNNYCRVLDADVIVNVQYTYPQWTDKQASNENVRKEWDSFMKYVVWHEQQHVKPTNTFAEQYLDLLKSTKYPILTECTSLPKLIRKKRNELYRQQLRKQKLFDRKEGSSSGLGRKQLIALKRIK